jgi:hypothetical protein
VLQQAKGQFHGGAQGILPKHKNAYCKRCVKESWPRKKEEEERDYWFNRLRPMTKPKQTWWEKQLGKEEGGSSGDSSGVEASKVTPARGEDNRRSGDRNPASVSATQSQETATQNRVTATRTRVTATRIRRVTGKE